MNNINVDFLENQNIDYQYVSDNKNLRKLIKILKKRKIFAIDTEFTRRTTYYSILSIIQIAISAPAENIFKRFCNLLKSKISGQKNQNKYKNLYYIIDCQSNLNLKPFYKIIANKKIKKIIHSASQDLQIFHKKSRLKAKGIIDTQIFANFCGYGFNVGYSKLVHDFFGKEIDKGQQNSNWQKRPLSEEQIKYSLLDVVFLERIYESFLEILKKRKKLVIFQKFYEEEFRNFYQKTINQKEDFLINKFKLSGKKNYQILRLKNLVQWREKWAKKINIPRRHFLDDDQIDELAIINKKVDFEIFSKNCNRVRNKKLLKEPYLELLKILNKKYSKRQLYKFEKNFSFYNKSKITSRQKEKLDQAKKLIAKIAKKNQISEQFLISSSELKNIILKPKGIKKYISKWRYKLLGMEIKKIIN
jgi:ribonuclease D